MKETLSKTYNIVSSLGAGTYGQVFGAIQIHSGKNVAIKLIEEV
jgi:serine/threonine protein kinase